MLDERVGKPIQRENCVGRVRKSWKKSLIEIKLSSNTKFPHPTRFSIFSQILRSAKPIQHFIQHGKNAMLDESWTGLLRPYAKLRYSWGYISLKMLR